MQIDTWNRDAMPFTRDGPPPAFAAGPLPRSSAAPAGAEYSGLLECPMTTRLTKVVDGDYALQNTGGCAAPIQTFQECFHAAATTLGTAGQRFANRTAADRTRPPGCSASVSPRDPLSVHVFFNTLSGDAGSAACGAGAAAGVLAGASAGIVGLTVRLEAAKDLVTLTLSGPADAWFAVGFGATAMGDRPWTVVVDGAGLVSERKLGGQVPNSHVEGDALAPSVTVAGSAVEGGVRTVVLTRALAGAGADYFSFNASAADPAVNFIQVRLKQYPAA